MDPDAWLAERLAGAPATLRARIEAALAWDAGGAAQPGDRLWSVAEHLLDQAKAGPPTRETAVALLAADALVTLACEWLAETDPERLDRPGPQDPRL